MPKNVGLRQSTMSEIPVPDALEVFGLGPEFSAEQLASAYRRVALMVHPDRGGTADMFDTVKKCFLSLERDLLFRSGTATHFDMKAESERSCGGAGRADSGNFRAPEGKFDSTRFNAVFEQHRFVDPVERAGYSDFMANGESERAPPPDRVRSVGALHDAFIARAGAAPSRALVVRPCESAGGSLCFAEIGVESVDDYSGRLGDVMGVDCKQAYSEQSMAAEFANFRDGGALGRPERVEAERAAAFQQAWDEQAQERHYREKEEAEKLDNYKRRVAYQRLRQEAEASHAKCNMLMLTRG